MQRPAGSDSSGIALQHAGLAGRDHHAPVGLSAPARRGRGTRSRRGRPSRSRTAASPCATISGARFGHEVARADRPRRQALDLAGRDVLAGALAHRGAAQHPGDVRRVGDRRARASAAVRPAPKTAAASTASRIAGNANRMSITTEIAESTQPPRQAATTASTTPATQREQHHERRARGSTCARRPAGGEEVAALAVEPQQVPGAGPDVGVVEVRRRRGRAARAPRRRSPANTREPDDDQADDRDACRCAARCRRAAAGGARGRGRRGAHAARLPSATRGSSTA